MPGDLEANGGGDASGTTNGDASGAIHEGSNSIVDLFHRRISSSLI